MKKIVVCVMVSMLFLTGCDWLFVDSGDESGGGSGGSGIGHIREFNAVQMYSDSPSVPITVTAKLVEESAYAKLYLKEGQTMPAIEYIATAFDSMYPKMINTYGNHTDIDNNGKVIILLYDINEEIDPMAGYVAGFFSPNDLTGSPYGNDAEVLYVESQVPNDVKNIFGTVIHEFQHLINWNMNTISNNRQSHLWLNEALSASSEILTLDVLDENDFGPIMPYNRFYTYAYGSEIGGSHESIQDGNYFYSWDYHDSDKVYADYATVSLFMYWTTLYYGYSTIESIAQASASARGTYQAVVEAFSENVVNPNGWIWETIMATWLLSNEFETVILPDEDGVNITRRGYPGGVAGQYESGILMPYYITFPNTKIHSGSSRDVSLSPGDAVLTHSEITNAIGEAGYLGKFDLSESYGTYITININKSVFLENHPKVGVTIPASIMSRSVQEPALPPPPKVTNRIIPFSHILVDENEGR